MHLNTGVWQKDIISDGSTFRRKLDLSSPDYAAGYGKVRVILGFQRFSAIGQDRTGQPIIYAITIPNTAPNPVLAQEFADFVVQMAQSGGKGMAGSAELIRFAVFIYHQMIREES